MEIISKWSRKLQQFGLRVIVFEATLTKVLEESSDVWEHLTILTVPRLPQVGWYAIGTLDFSKFRSLANTISQFGVEW